MRSPPEVKTRRAPAQRPGQSFQDYETPLDFLAAVEKRFGKPEVDLAALPTNAKAPVFVTPTDDSLSFPWSQRFKDRRCWLNPPFGRILPWAVKCALEGPEMGRRGTIMMLTPASVGAEWFAEHVDGKALVLALRGRLSFDGKAPYPKDCILSVFGVRYTPRFEVWDWRAST